jgi:hypothetical protein
LVFLLEKEPSGVHICGMANDESIANGFEREQTAAKFEGYNAMFFLLAAGRNL